ncbi:CHAT domain-containing tetratricopeptide repeat protein [Azospirillum lipoferum]|uniref:CHAT domain-containing protein n=1 Tax=Azospirillum lipoferum (strain 4B) TaxID=862719 RepID=G7ZE22_AZOL4|nr:CHAT domain-containing protein [Azospirillum lipoferum]CBS89269.1 protein of unknown function with TPR repeat domain [Azospirillum lipoferum 4B]
MTREEAERLVGQVLAASDETALQRLIEEHAAGMGPLFFELLEARASEPLLLDVARRHLALTGGAALSHLDLAMRLLEAHVQGRLAEAVEELRPALDEDAVDTLIKAAEAGITRRADLGLGRRMLDVARAALESGGHDRLRPTLALEECNYFLLTDDTAAAEACLRGVLDGDAPITDPLLRHALAVNLGVVLLRQGRYADLVRHYTDLLPEIDDDRLRHSARSNLALAHGALGHTGTALTMFLELAEDCRRLGDEDQLATVHGNLALLHERLGLPEEEERHLRVCLDLALNPTGADRTRDWHSVATSCCNLHLFHLRRREFAKAAHWLTQYEKITRGTGVDPDGVTRGRLRLEFAIAHGDLPAALEIADSLVPRLPERVDEEVLAMLGSAGRVMLRAGRLDRAAELFERIVALCERSGHGDLLLSGLGYLGVVRLRTDKTAEAVALFARMTALDRQLRGHVDDPLHQFTFSSQHEALYEEVIGALIDGGDAGPLFDGLQAAKAFAIGHRHAAPAGFAELSAALPPGTAFLEYDHRAGRSVCVVAVHGAAEPVLVSLPLGERELVEAAARFDRCLVWARSLLAGDPFDWLEPVARGLLHPVIERLGTDVRHLVIAPAGGATRLPFHILPLAGGGRVIDRFAVSYAPSATVWLAAAARARRPASFALAAGGKRDDGEGLRRGFTDEGEAVRRLLRSAGCRELAAAIGTGDTCAALLDHLEADILHVAAHGLFDPARPAASGLSLSADGEDRFVSLEALAHRQTAAELVFLSGCDTGRVAPLRNQEALGLVSVLLSQRVTAAALSFWPILGEGAVAPDIVAAFYHGWLLEGLSKAEALRQAMLRHRDRPLYEWAGYGLFGFAAEVPRNDVFPL